MIIAVTGTPGTGKTSVARELAEMLGYDYVDVNQVAERDAVDTEEDPERGVTAVDVGSLVEVLQEEVEEDAVLDGHFAHRFPADLTVVLRCEPGELEDRMRGRGWDEEKIEENLEAEVLDLVLQVAVMEREEVLEVDTTGKDPSEVSDAVARVAESGEIPEEMAPGNVSWDPEKYV